MPATALAFAPDGRFLAVGRGDGSTIVYALPGMVEVATLKSGPRRAAIRALGFAPDPIVPYEVRSGSAGRWLLAAGDQGGELVVWDVNARQPRAFCRGSPFQVSAAAFRPDGLTLASCGRMEARVWDVCTGRVLLRLAGQGTDDSQALAFSSDGKRLMWGSKAGFSSATVGVWQIEDGRGVRVLRGLSSSARRVWFCPSSRLLAAVSDNWQAGVWELGTGRLVWLFEVARGTLADNAAAAFHPDGVRFAFAAGREARLYDLRSGRLVQAWDLPPGLCDELQFDRKDRLLLLRREGSSKGRGSTQWKLRDLLGPNGPVVIHEQTDTNWVTFSTVLPAGGDVFLVGSAGPLGIRRSVRAYDVGSGQLLWERSSQRDKGELSLVWDSAGHWFGYTAGLASTLELLRLPAGEGAGVAPEGCNGISPSGDRYAFASAYGSVGCQLFDRRGLPHGVKLGADWQGIGPPVFSPDGRHLAWGTMEGPVLVADLGEVERRLAGFWRASGRGR